MAIHELNFATMMEHLDGGRVHAAFNEEVKRVVNDCIDRPGDDKARKVTLTFELSPVVDESMVCDEVSGKFQVTSTVPKRRTKKYSFGVRKRSGEHQLVFNDLSDDNVNQRTIDE